MDDRNMRVTDERDEEFSINIWEWIRFLWVHRRFISAVTGAFAVIGVVIALALPPKYTATATILPPQNSDSKLSGLLSSFSGLAGDIMGGGNMSELYPDIAKSRNVLTGLLDATYEGKTFESVLSEKYGKKGNGLNDREFLLFMLQNVIVRVSTSAKTDVVTLSVTDRDPKFAAALANEVLNQMEKYFKVTYRSTASSQRMMIESRLHEVTKELRDTEDKMLFFEESNRATGLSPRLLLSQGRLQREVQINNTLYMELTRQYELSKISELQLKPVLNVLDRAAPPFKKSKPVRRKIVALWLILGFVASVTYLKAAPVVYHEVVGKLRDAE